VQGGWTDENLTKEGGAGRRKGNVSGERVHGVSGDEDQALEDHRA
jgi:hypothetical protein